MEKSNVVSEEKRKSVRIFLTQPVRLFEGLPHRLEKINITPYSIPVSETRLLEHNILLYQAIRQIEMYDWLILLGKEEAELFFDLLLEMKVDVRSLRSLKIMAASCEVAESLKKRGLFAAYSCIKLDPVSVGEELLAKQSRRERYLILWSQWLPEQLTVFFSSHGISYDGIPVSRQVSIGHPDILLQKGDRVLFCDGLSVASFSKMTQEADFSNVIAFCLTQAAFMEAKKAGYEAVLVDVATEDGIVDAVQRYQGGREHEPAKETVPGRNGAGSASAADTAGAESD